MFDITRTKRVLSGFKNIFLPPLYVGLWLIKHILTHLLDWRMWPLQQKFPWIIDTNIKNVVTTTEVSTDQRRIHKKCGHYKFPWISDTGIKNVAIATKVSMDQRNKHKEIPTNLRRSSPK